MQQVMSFALAPVKDLQLRPLLYAAGVTGVAAGLYLIMKRRYGERTEERVHGALIQDPEQTMVVDYAPMSDVDGVSSSVRHIHSSIPEERDHMNSLKSEKEHQEVVEINTRLESEKVKLMFQVVVLKGSLQEVVEELNESENRNDKLMSDLWDETEKHNALKSEHDVLKKQHGGLLKDYERVQGLLKAERLKSEQRTKTFHEETKALKETVSACSDQ